jgi:hypothetical protein
LIHLGKPADAQGNQDDDKHPGHLPAHRQIPHELQAEGTMAFLTKAEVHFFSMLTPGFRGH